MRFETDVMGISLYRAAIDTAELENPTRIDKAKRQTVLITAWRFASLNNRYNNTLLKGRILRF